MSFIVSEDAMRPASDKKRCFYCQQAIGQEHKPDCVLIVKTVTVRMTVEYDIRVPHLWTKELIEYGRNKGTWCANNALDELREMSKHSCLCFCGNTHFECINPDGAPFLKET
jgi:hypothetical protein